MFIVIWQTEHDICRYRFSASALISLSEGFPRLISRMPHHRHKLGPEGSPRMHPHADAPRCVSCNTSDPPTAPREGALRGGIKGTTSGISVSKRIVDLIAAAEESGDPLRGPRLKPRLAANSYMPPIVPGACTVRQACLPLKQAGVECDAPRAHGGAVGVRR